MEEIEQGEDEGGRGMEIETVMGNGDSNGSGVGFGDCRLEEER